MSNLQTTLNADLTRLQNSGYSFSIIGDYIVISDVPYLDSHSELKMGTLACQNIELPNGSKPDHTIFFMGEFQGDRPFDFKRQPLDLGVVETQIIFSNEIRNAFRFSRKPDDGYMDYYDKFTAYISYMLGEVIKLFPEATPILYRNLSGIDSSAFHYADNSSPYGCLGKNDLRFSLKDYKVAIIGLGGTGSYVLDHLSKTPLAEIHLFDQDVFLQRNAFRAPGAPFKALFEQGETKVNYFSEIYSRMKKNIIPHAEYITPENVSKLSEMDFVFICVDSGLTRKVIYEYLNSMNIPFIDSAIGVNIESQMLSATIDTIASDKNFNDQYHKFVEFSDVDFDNEYSQNIQVSEINAMAAAFAVIRWKKGLFFYESKNLEFNSTYILGKNKVFNVTTINKEEES